MLPIDTEPFTLIYPIKLTAPLPIEECKNRLQQSLGKAMGTPFTPIKGEVGMIDATTCKFRLYQDVDKGGRRTIVGYLYAQTVSSTEVDAVFGIESNPYTFLLIISMLCVTILTFILILHQVIGALVAALLLGAFFYSERRKRSTPPRPPRKIEKEPMNQLLWWFVRTLKQ